MMQLKVLDQTQSRIRMEQLIKSQWLDYAKLNELYIHLKCHGYEDLSEMVAIASVQYPDGEYVKNLFDNDTFHKLKLTIKYYQYFSFLLY